jgi:hypothetical protein
MLSKYTTLPKTVKSRKTKNLNTPHRRRRSLLTRAVLPLDHRLVDLELVVMLPGQADARVLLDHHNFRFEKLGNGVARRIVRNALPSANLWHVLLN